MGRKLIKRKITANSDAIQSSEPSSIEVSAKQNRIQQQLAQDEAQKQARLEYIRNNALKPGVLLMSDADIDRAITLQQIRPAQLYQDNKTEDQRKAAQRAFEQQEQRQQFEKQLEAADAVMSVSTDYIPIVGSLLRGGQYQATKDVLGYDEANKRYSPLIGATLDLATLPFGVASKSLAASYAGGMAGRYVGDKFNNPHAGQFVGTLLGHPTANFAANSANNARRFYNGYRLGQALNNSLKNTKLIVKPVEHVSPFGITNGSSLDVGTEGIHLSSIGSSTTPRVEQFFLNEGKFPFVRTGTWTYSTNTKPVWVKDVGSFKRGYNPDFDSKVDNGITNFSYTNNFEGKGNTSYATMEPSFGLQLSKNIKDDQIDWNAPAVKTSEGLRLVDGTMTPNLRGTLYNYLGFPSEYFNYTSIKSHPEWGEGFIGEKYSQNGRDYYIGENSNRSKVVYKLPGESDFHMIEPTSEQDYWRIIGEINDAILTSRHRFIESLPDNEIKNIVRSQGISKETDLSGLDNSYSIEGTRLGDILQSKVKNDIQDVYLSDEYITRYMKSVGISPENRDFRELLKNRISYDLNKTYNKAIPAFYRTEDSNGGASDYLIDYFGRPIQFKYGINGNMHPDYLQNDWTSILFHEFGHNIFADTTPFSKYIRKHSATLRYNYPLEFTKPEYVLQSYDPDSFVNYISKLNEFRQRIMEGVRYGIKEGNLTPEEIYNECEISGFKELKKYFRKDYLIKMLGLMLSTTPVIVNSNDKTS